MRICSSCYAGCKNRSRARNTSCRWAPESEARVGFLEFAGFCGPPHPLPLFLLVQNLKEFGRGVFVSADSKGVSKNAPADKLALASVAPFSTLASLND